MHLHRKTLNLGAILKIILAERKSVAKGTVGYIFILGYIKSTHGACS